MRGFPSNLFQPQEEVSRVQVLVSLANGLNLSPESPQATASATTNQATTPVTTTRRVTKKPKFLPLGILALMQPAIMASANTQAVLPSGSTEPIASDQGMSSRSSTSSVPSGQNVAANRPLSSVVSNYYTDAGQIPQYAVDDVAAATKANIVVNYPNVRVLNPNEPLNRGAAAALIYQTLVHQGKLSPLPSSVEASNYIVGFPSK